MGARCIADVLIRKLNDLPYDMPSYLYWTIKQVVYRRDSYTNEYGTGKIHYYKNVVSGKINYYDAKMKISSPKLIRDRLINKVTDKDGFGL